MIYELRIYTCPQDKFMAELDRYEKYVLPLWDKHGIRLLGGWTVLVGGDNLLDQYYLLGWESLAERERIWEPFRACPEWLAIRAETERDGPLVTNMKNILLTPTRFSKMQ
jgi:hypothetical protein